MSRKLLYLFIVLFFFGCNGKTGKQSIVIDIWYGEQQEFGKLGLPQKWINILGNVQSKNGIKSFTYTLNASDPKALTLGSDLHRLAAKGDFNVELDIEECVEGVNELVITALDSAGNSMVEEISISVQKNNRWPLPYSIRWSEVENIQDVVQVIDGYWVITKDGLHNEDIYYDRVVAIGDASWKNYEVSTTVIFHDFTPPQKGPPTYNVSHAAIASRWPGHSKDNLQPSRQWYPLGATSEFRLSTGMDSCRWRIFDGPKPDSKRFYVEQAIADYRPIVQGKVYGMKHRVESIDDDKTRYSAKLWLVDNGEPPDWDLYGIEEEENIWSGSALLIAHNTSVTFGDVYVTPIED